jgi:hypothetical protein
MEFSKTCVEINLYRFFIGGIIMMGRKEEYQNKLEFIDLSKEDDKSTRSPIPAGIGIKMRYKTKK